MRSRDWQTAFVLMALFTVGVVAQQVDPNAAPPAATEGTVQTPQPMLDATASAPEQKAGPELLRKMKTNIDVTFDEAPIEQVIKTLAEKGNIDIVKGPAVTGTVTATLTGVPWDEAMESILSVHGYGYTTSESIVRVVPKNELEQYTVRYVTKLYHIDYADIESVNKAIKEVISKQGKIAMNVETGDMWVTDTETNIEFIDAFIETMDREIPQILVEARIYDVSCSAFLDLGFDWSAGTFTLFDSDTGMAIAGRTEPYFGGAFGSSIGQAPKGGFGLSFGVLNEHVDLNATLTAVKDDVKARLLANPKILVLNGEQADIKIVSEIPYQELTQTSGGGNIGTTKFKEVGVELQVTPQITREGKIRLLLNPIFSVQTGSVSLVIPTGLTSVSSPQPIVDRREAMTQALIQDGQTVVIGGLRKRDVVQEISSVPLLSDIPVLGGLFQFKGEKAVNSELIVFITPHIAEDLSLSPSDAQKLDSMNCEFREPGQPSVSVDCGTSGCEEP